MNKLDETKLNPRNAPAFRKIGARNPTPHLVAGNPISTRLESSIGNCFPGLECDLRNLERRFFPFLEMDMPDQQIVLFKVDIDGAEKARDTGKITKAALAAYRRLRTGGPWIVETMSGTFGPLGRLKLTIANLPNTSTGPNRLPPDPWTAVRLLTEGTDVHLVLHEPRILGQDVICVNHLGLPHYASRGRDGLEPSRVADTNQGRSCRSSTA